MSQPANSAARTVFQGEEVMSLKRADGWLPVPGRPEFQVASDGRIKGVKGKEMNPMRNETGHLFVTSGRKSKKLYVHRAVLFAFIGPPPPDQEARHLNGIPDDNRLENLAWGTKQQQHEDDRRNGTPRGSGPQKLTPDKVHEIRGLQFILSSREVARKFGISHTVVQKIWRRKIWRSLGEKNVTQPH